VRGEGELDRSRLPTEFFERAAKATDLGILGTVLLRRVMLTQPQQPVAQV
jgi:hypothetical protein